MRSMRSTTATAIPDLLSAQDLSQRARLFPQVVQGPQTAGLRQHPPVRGRPSRLFRGLHGDRTGLGEAHGLRLATAQPLVKIGRRAKASEFFENLTAVKLNSPLTVLEFLERISPHLTE
jgi:hypothetical protein